MEEGAEEKSRVWKNEVTELTMAFLALPSGHQTHNPLIRDGIRGMHGHTKL